MPPSLHHSMVKKSLVVVCCVVSLCVVRPVLAQHATARPAGGAVHISAPPSAHIPTSSTPIFHAPIYTARPSSVLSAGVAFNRARVRPPRRPPIYPFPPVLVIYTFPGLLGPPFWGLNSCWWGNCDLFWPWPLGYIPVSFPAPTNYVSQVYETPVYVYGDERPDLPQLFLKDGTILNVTDYWLVDDQLHFTMTEEEGGKPAEHVVPFDALDLQRTVNVNTGRGFRFMLRNEPFEQYVRDHPEGSPPVITPPHE
jgi:hypothetical protein